MKYIMAVADGEEQVTTRAAENRLATCWRIVDKLIPTLKAVEMEVGGDIELRWKS